MKYHDFLQALETEVKSRISKDVIVELQSIPKNNGLMLDAFVFHIPSVNIGPVIYLDGFFSDYQDGVGIIEIAKAICREAVKHMPSENMDMQFLYDYELVRPMLAFSLINTKNNKSRLDKIPHIEFLDLAIVFFCLFELDNGATGSMTVNNEILSHWGCTIDKVKKDAFENAPKILPASIVPIVELLRRMAEPDSELFEKIGCFETSPLYVLSNEKGSNGAASMLYPDLLKEFSTLNEDKDFYILPSSVHEVILVPAEDGVNAKWLEDMVHTVNSEQVPTMDILSDNVYYFSSLTGEIEIASN